MLLDLCKHTQAHTPYPGPGLLPTSLIFYFSGATIDTSSNLADTFDIYLCVSKGCTYAAA